MRNLCLSALGFVMASCVANPDPALVVPPAATAQRDGVGSRAGFDPQQPGVLEPTDPEQRGIYPSYAGILTATLGYREFESGKLWGPLQEPFEIGLEYCFRPKDSLFGLAVGVMGTYDDQNETRAGIKSSVQAATLEGYIGPKLYLEPKAFPLQLHAGVGGAFLYAELERVVGSDESETDDATFGLYGQVGAALRLDRGNSIGLEYRVLTATHLVLSDVSGNANYSQVALTFSHAF